MNWEGRVIRFVEAGISQHEATEHLAIGVGSRPGGRIVFDITGEQEAIKGGAAAILAAVIRRTSIQCALSLESNVVQRGRAHSQRTAAMLSYFSRGFKFLVNMIN
jgi:hypothetical protein